MSLKRIFASLVVVSGLLVAGGCSVDQATAPVVQPPASASLLSGVVGLTSPITGLLISSAALQRTTPLAQPISASIRLYGTGGTLTIPGTGFSLTIPRSAIGDTAVTITATALAGSTVAYDFEPHGAKFAAALTFHQSLANTNYDGSLGLLTPLQGGYFADDSQLDTSTGLVLLNQLLPATLLSNTVSFNVYHFSGYLVSTGRQ